MATDPDDEDDDGDDLAALLLAVNNARRQMHQQTATALGLVLLTYGATVHVPTLRDRVDPAAPYSTRRGQAQTAIADTVPRDVAAAWRSTVQKAHTAAVTGGVYAAGHLISAGQIPATSDDDSALADPFSPDAWITDQQGGMGGDLAVILAGDGAEDVADADVASVVAAGPGALYYLDEQTGDAWMFGSAQQYEATGTGLVDWNTMGDGRVCATCRALEDGSPYPVAQVPDVPHGGCRCWITPTS